MVQELTPEKEGRRMKCGVSARHPPRLRGLSVFHKPVEKR
jgi:hypothetical protein